MCSSHGQVFKDEIEKPDQPGGPILDPQEIKSIFGGLVPIYDVHVKIRDELAGIVTASPAHWPVGSAFLKHVCQSFSLHSVLFVASVKLLRDFFYYCHLFHSSFVGKYRILDYVIISLNFLHKTCLCIWFMCMERTCC